eukprot:scaffold203768_cov39-Tisochrysis_lutea.AAC.1
MTGSGSRRATSDSDQSPVSAAVKGAEGVTCTSLVTCHLHPSALCPMSYVCPSPQLRQGAAHTQLTLRASGLER